MKKLIVLLSLAATACASRPPVPDRTAQQEADAFLQSIAPSAAAPQTGPDVLALLEYQEQRIEVLEQQVKALHNYAETSGQLELDRLTAERDAARAAQPDGQ